MHFPFLYTMAKDCSLTTCTLTSQFPGYKIHTVTHETLRFVPRVKNRKQTITNFKVLNFSHTKSKKIKLWCSLETTWKLETQLNDLKENKFIFFVPFKLWSFFGMFWSHQKLFWIFQLLTERPAKLATPAKPVFTCTGCKTVLVLPIPSTVVTAIPSTAHNGIKQPFAEKCLFNVKVWLFSENLKV